MKRSSITTAIAVLAIGFTTLASAQPRDPRNDPRNGHRPPPPRVQPAPVYHGGPAHHPVPRHHMPRDVRHVDRGPGVGPDHRFHRGDRMPAYYRSHYYVVNDWRNHRLQAPPRGYNWVQSGADYALVAIATGVIAQIILAQ